MTNDLLAPPRAPARARTLTPWIGLAIAVLLIIAAAVFPALAGVDVHVQDFPPLLASWMPRVGPGTIPAIVIAVLAARYAVDLAQRMSWWMLLVGAFAASLAWMLSLATVDGWNGLATLDTEYEYLRTARAVTDFGAVLHEYIARIPADAVGSWPVHIAGHPPGALLFFVVLVRLGLGGAVAAGVVVTIIAATTPVAVLLAVRRLGAEGHARRAAPFLILGPAAIWMSVSADAMFGAVAAWGLCVLAYAATARGPARTASWGALAGLLLGFCVMLSYGLPLLGVLALVVLMVARRWSPLPWAAGAAALVVLAFAANGFAWWQAYPVLTDRYWAGVASDRPTLYWIWANFASLAMSAGPLVGAGLAVALASIRVSARFARSTTGLSARSLSEERSDETKRTSLRSPWTAARSDAVVIALAVAALLSVVLADLTLMSKSEVERIWLPFVPWLLLSTALLPERWRRWGLVGQLVFALLLQHALVTVW